MKRMILVLAALGAAACGGAALPQGSCTIQPAGGSKTCIDYSAASLDMWKTGCANAMGTWSTGLCTHTNAAGGCLNSQGGISITTWLYAPATTDNVKQTCQPPGVYVAP